MTRVALVLHERFGTATWSAQLRPRLAGLPVRWFETRSHADLVEALTGQACPVVLIDLRNSPAEGLADLAWVSRLSSAARVLLLDPVGHEEVADLARELGATHAISGFVPPPVVANLLARWIDLAVRQSDREGWSRPLPVDASSDLLGWIESLLAQSLESGAGEATA